jgi:hypothetical protein
LICSPSLILGYGGWSFFNNSSFFIFSSVQEILPLTNFVFKWSRPIVEKRNINFRQLVPSPLISTFFSSCTRSQWNPNKEKFWVPCNLLSKSFPKIPSNPFFLGHQLAPGFLLVTE